MKLPPKSPMRVKDIKWLRNKLVYLHELDMWNWNQCEPNSREQSHFNGCLATYKKALDFIDELDEPEVLSQKWIDEHSNGPSCSQYVWVDDLKELLAPKQEATGEEVMHWIGNNEFYDHATAETVLANAVDKGELGYYGTKYSVVKKPVIPKYVADLMEDYNDASIQSFLSDAFRNYREGRADRADTWIVKNSADFVDAYRYEYEVEEEPLYYVKMPNTEEYLTLEEDELYFTDMIYWIGEKPKNITQLFTEGQLKKYNEIYWKNAQEIEDYDEQY